MSLPSKETLVKYIEKAVEQGKGRNFRQSVELVIVLKDVDLKSQQLKIREVVNLPKGRGKEAKVCLVGDPEIVDLAKEAGVQRVILSTELRDINKKQAKKIASECDWILVKPDLMGLVGRVLGPALGPRGKIPIPMPTGGSLKAIVSRYKNSVMVRIKDQPVLMTMIGTEDMNPEDLADNAMAILTAIESKLPARYGNIEKLVFKTTMGIPVEVEL